MEDNGEKKSKTQIKKEVEELQKLGVELIQLTNQQLDRLEIPDKLRTALIDARSIKSNIAARRQRQFIGALMREVDPEPLRLALLEADIGCDVESELTRDTRKWMERLLTGDSAVIEEALLTFPGLERQRLRQLLRNIGKEKKGTSTKSLKALEQMMAKCLEEK